MPRGIKGSCSLFCSKCKVKKENNKYRYCLKCRNDWQKNYRKSYILKPMAAFKANVRHKTKMRIRRGLLIKGKCEVCGLQEVEAHHDDYNQPYQVRWLCKQHHREHHKEMKANELGSTKPMDETQQKIQSKLPECT